MNPDVAEIIGPDLLIVLVLMLVLFGGSKLPKLARSVGSAKSEFEKGLREANASPSTPLTDEAVTMTQADLDALLAEREEQAKQKGRPGPKA